MSLLGYRVRVRFAVIRGRFRSDGNGLNAGSSDVFAGTATTIRADTFERYGFIAAYVAFADYQGYRFCRRVGIICHFRTGR